jgi:hypothetical protein
MKEVQWFGFFRPSHPVGELIIGVGQLHQRF